MRILYCNKYNFRFSGTESYLFAAMEAMRARGHEVALFSMADPRGQATAYDRHFVPHIDFKSAHNFLDKVRLASRAIYSATARVRIRAMIEEFRPDVAHVRNIYHHLSPSILWELKAHGIPVVYHVNDFKLLCPNYNFVTASGENCERCITGNYVNVVRHGCYSGGRIEGTVLAMEAYLHRWLGTYEKCVDLLLAPSRFVKEKFVASGWPASRISVLPHFQDLPQNSVPGPGNNAPILYFGRLSPEKGVADLIQAMSKLPQIQLTIAGDGPQRCELERLTTALQLHNVTFTGHVHGNNLDRLIAVSQFTIFPSHAYETFGKSILESYAHARPVIATDLGSRREVLLDGETGVLYRSGSVQQLSAAISFLYERPELACRMGEAGRRLVAERFTRERHLLALDHIYQSLVRERTHAVSVEHKPLKLRVAFIGGRGVIGKYSGVETYYEEMGRRLAHRGHLVTAYCRSYFTPNVGEHNGVSIVRLPTIRTKHLDTFVHTFLSTVHACFADCDIVHYQTLGPALFSFLPRLFKKKTIVTVQGLDWQRAKWSSFARYVLEFGEWASARMPNKTVVVSEVLQNRYRSLHSRDVSYVPNGTVIRDRRDGPFLKKLGLTSGSYALFLGRLSPEKNCELLARTFANIDTQMKLVFAGGSSHTDHYVARLRKYASDSIIFLDWLAGDALEEVLTNAALFVLPSDLEGLSLALLDAMAAGVCVLASDIPENYEVIGNAGFTFKRGDAADLKRMLSFLLSNGQVRAAVGKMAKARAQKYYLWDEIAIEMENIYKDVRDENSNRRKSETFSAKVRGLFAVSK